MTPLCVLLSAGVPLTLATASPHALAGVLGVHGNHTAAAGHPLVLPAVRAHHAAGVGLFFFASLHQYRCHRILADLRGAEAPSRPAAAAAAAAAAASATTAGGGPDAAARASSIATGAALDAGGKSGSQSRCRYTVPRGDWFELVSCPHYLAEILVYVSFAVISGGVRAGHSALLLSVVVNLGWTARQTHGWYKEKFEDYPEQVASSRTTHRR